MIEKLKGIFFNTWLSGKANDLEELTDDDKVRFVNNLIVQEKTKSLLRNKRSEVEFAYQKMSGVMQRFPKNEAFLSKALREDASEKLIPLIETWITKNKEYEEIEKQIGSYYNNYGL